MRLFVKFPYTVLRVLDKKLRKEIYKNVFDLSKKFSEKPSKEANLEEEIEHIQELLSALEEIAAYGNKKYRRCLQE